MGHSKRFLGRLTVVSVALALLAGCTGDPQGHAGSRAVVELRQAAASRLADALAPFRETGEVIGESTDDVCDPGQSNTKSSTIYRFRCDRSQRILIALRQSTPATASAAMQAAVAALGCAPSFTRSGAEIGGQLAKHPGGLAYAIPDCGSVEVHVSWVTDARQNWQRYDHVVLENRSVPAMPYGFTVEFVGFTDAQFDQVVRAKPFAWWVEAKAEYAYELR